MRREVLVGMLLVCLVLGAIPINSAEETQVTTVKKWSENGHYYELIKKDVNWNEAKEYAEKREFEKNGVVYKGYLATLTSQEENSWVVENLVSPTGKGDVYPWLGGYQVQGYNNNPSEGWKWVTGEDWSWTNWNEGEPNDLFGRSNERYLKMYPGGKWNDESIDGEPGWENYILIEYQPAEEQNAPQAIRVAPSSSTVSVAHGEKQTFRIKATDEDGDLHMVQWEVNGEWKETDSLATLNAPNIEGSADFSYTFEESSTVKAIVYDEQMNTDLIIWDVEVTSTPTPTEERIITYYDFAKGYSDKGGLGPNTYKVRADATSTRDGQMYAFTSASSSAGGAAASVATCVIRKSFIPEVNKKYEITFNYDIIDRGEPSEIKIKRFSPLLGTAVVESTVKIVGSVYDDQGKPIANKTQDIHNYALPEHTKIDAASTAMAHVFSYYTKDCPELNRAILPLTVTKSLLEVCLPGGEISLRKDEQQLKVYTPKLVKNKEYTIEFLLYSYLGSASFIEASGGYNRISVKLKSISIEPVDIEPPSITFTEVPESYPTGDTVTISWKGESKATADLKYKFYLKTPYEAEVTPPRGVGDLSPELGDWSSWTEEESITYTIPKTSSKGAYIFYVKVRDKWGNEGGPIKTAFNMFDFLVIPSTDKKYYDIGDTVPIKLEITNKRSQETEVGIVPCFKDSGKKNCWCIPQEVPPKYKLTIPVDGTKSVNINWKIPDDAKSGQCSIGVLTIGPEGFEEKYSNNLLETPLFYIRSQAPDLTIPPPTWSPEEPEEDITKLIDELIAWWNENREELFKAAHEFIDEIFKAIDELISEYKKGK